MHCTVYTRAHALHCVHHNATPGPVCSRAHALHCVHQGSDYHGVGFRWNESIPMYN